MKIMVTGGTGFVGGNLVDKLVNQKNKVKCLAREKSNLKNLETLGIEIIHGDLLDFNSLLKATNDVDLVCHCAALVTDWASPQDFYNVNVQGTMNVLEACVQNKVRRFVHISSSDAIWKFDHHIGVDENHPYPDEYKHPYCKTKAESERLAIRYGCDGRLETVILRPCLVWGPGDTVILPRMVKLALNEVLYPVGDGSNLVSLTYIENLSDAIMLACKSEKAEGDIYFINDDERITYQEYVYSLLASLGINWSPKMSIPPLIAYGVAGVMEFWAELINRKSPPSLTRYAVALMSRNLNYSIAKAKRELNYRPATGFYQGLNATKNWVNSIGGISALLEFV